MEIKKTNDMFAAILQRPQANLNDLYVSNITLANTQLLKPEEYKMLPKVQNMFKTDSGAFDDAKFTDFYNKAANLYQDLSLTKSAARALEYDPMDYTASASAKDIDVRPIARMDYNPMKMYYSLTGVNSIDESNLSLRELAQQSKIFDVESGKWLDESANDKGFFGTTFGKTLVYAQWDNDGENFNPFTNRVEKHKKGDWKINDEGNYYVETLGKREIYGKQIVNPQDLITKEGTALNKIDFFDSDGKTKSVFGTTMKLATEIAPFLIPGFNIGGAAIKIGQWYGALKMGIGLASVLPTFYKSAEGLILGDNEDGIETNLWKGMNTAEGFMKKFTTKSFSDEANGSMWNYEQLGSMVSDVFSQIYEQRAIAGLSKVLYKMDDEADLKRIESMVNEASEKAINKGLITTQEQAKNIAEQAFKTAYEGSGINKSRSQLAKSLSLGYMAMVQSGDVYGEALAGGYDRRTAGFTALMAAAGQYGLMANNRMGDWFLDRTTGYTEGQSTAVIKKLSKSLLQDTQEAFNKFEVNAPEGRKALAGIFSKFKNGFTSILKEPLEQSEIVENLWKRSVIEGVEEVTEQAAIDAAKGISDTLSYLGLTKKKGSFGGFKNVFSEEGLQNYLANLIGGMLGGPMFELERSVISPALNSSFEAPTTKAELYDIVSTGRTQELLDEIQKQKSKFGSSELSPIATKLPNGESVFLPTESMSQADIIANALTQRVKNIEKIINTESLDNTDEDIIRKSILNQVYIDDLTKSGVDKFVLSDVKELGEQIVDLREKIEAFKEDTANPKLKELTEQLNTKRQEITDILTGTKEEDYHGLALFALNNKYHRPFLNMTIDEYVKEKYDKDYYKLSDSEKNDYLNKFEKDKDLTEGSFKDKIKFMYKAFKGINEAFGPTLIKYDEDGYASVRSGFFEMLHKVSSGEIDYKTALNRLNEVNAVLKKGTHDIIDQTFQGVNLDTDTNISLGQFLVDNGIIGKKYNLSVLQEANQKRKETLKNTLGEFENDEDFNNAVVEALQKNNIAKKLKALYPNYESLTAPEIMEALETPLEIGEQKIDFTSLSEEEKNIVRNSIGTALANPDIEKVQSEFENEISDKDGFSEEEKAIVVNFLDNLGLETSMFDENTLEQIIKESLKETNQNIDEYSKRIDAVGTEEEKEIKNYVLPATSVINNLKINKKGRLEINARRALLLTYVNQMKDSGKLIDSRALEELQRESDLLDNLVRYRTDIDHFYNMSTDEDWENYYQDELDKVEEALNYAKSHNKENDLYSKLKNFEIEIFGWNGPVSFFEILQDNINAFSKNVTVKSDFIRSDIQLEQIKKAEYTIKAVKAVVESMSSTEWGEGNLYGMNVMLNKALEKEGKNPTYQTLSSQAAVTIMRDLELVEAKLNYFKELALSNSVSPIENDNKIKDVFIKNIINQYLDEDFNNSLINLKLGGKMIFSSDDLDKIIGMEDNEAKMIEIEDIFYQRFHKASGTLEEKLADLSKQIIPSQEDADFIKIATEMNLNTDFKKMDNLTWFKWVHTILASNSKKFYEEYKNIVEKELSLQEEKKDKKAPLFSQMIVIRSADAYVKNKQIVANVATVLQNDIEVSDDINEIVDAISQLTSKFRIQNIQAILGSGGTGKSSVIANTIINFLTNNSKVGPKLKVTAIAPSKNTLNVISKDLTAGIDLSVVEKTTAEQVNSLLTLDGQAMLQKAISWLSENELNDNTFNDFNNIEGLSDYFLAGKGDGAVLIRKKFFNDFLQPFANDEIHLIIGDEMSKYTTLEWQILNAASAKNNVYTILMGDELQSGIHIGKNSFSMENIVVNSSIKMKNTIRAKNTLKSDNSVTLEAYTQRIKQKYLYNSGEDILPVDLFYNEGTYLTGDKLVSEITTEDLRKLDLKKEIVVITENGQMSPELEAQIKEVFGDKPIEVLNKEVQGREFDQVIIDLNIKSNNLYEETREFYTLLSRAKEATLAKLETNVKYNLSARANSRNSFISKDMIVKALTDRLDFIKTLDLNSSTYDSINSIETLGTENVSDEDYKKDLGFVDPVSVNDMEIPIESDDEPAIKDNAQKDLNKMLSYSFFSNLGLSTDDTSGASVLDNYLDTTIGTGEGQITWENLREELKDYITNTDLFAIEDFSAFEGRTVKDIVHEYIKFKNSILFSKKNTSLLGINTKNTKWVIKKIYDAKNDSKKLLSYKKLVNHNISQNNIYAIGVYVSIDGKTPIFVTLSVTPDLQNANVKKENLNVDLLKSIYDRVDVSENNEALIDPTKISIYKRPYIPKHKEGINKNRINEVELKDFNKVFPGAEIELQNNNQVRVFWGTNDKIVDEYEDLTGIRLTDKKQIENLRFRPYIVVNFAKGRNDTRRLILLNNKKRTAAEFWNEFKTTHDKYGNAEKNDERAAKTAQLISKYRAWELMFNFIKYLKSNNPNQVKPFIEDLNLNFQWMTERNAIKWDSLPGVINSMAEFNMNGEDPFNEWIKMPGLYQGIVKDSPDVTTMEANSISNVLYYAYRILTGNYASLFDSFLQEYPNKIYHNPLIESIGVEGSAYGTLKDSADSYNVNVAIEPNKVLVDMNKLLVDVRPDANLSINNTKKSSEETKTVNKYKKSFEISGVLRFVDDEDPIKSTTVYKWDLSGIDLKHTSNPDGILDNQILEQMDNVFRNFVQMGTKEDNPYIIEIVGDDGIAKLVYETYDSGDRELIDLQTYAKNAIYNIKFYTLSVDTSGNFKKLTPTISALNVERVNPNEDIKCNIK